MATPQGTQLSSGIQDTLHQTQHVQVISRVHHAVTHQQAVHSQPPNATRRPLVASVDSEVTQTHLTRDMMYPDVNCSIRVRDLHDPNPHNSHRYRGPIEHQLNRLTVHRVESVTQTNQQRSQPSVLIPSKSVRLVSRQTNCDRLKETRDSSLNQTQSKCSTMSSFAYQNSSKIIEVKSVRQTTVTRTCSGSQRLVLHSKTRSRNEKNFSSIKEPVLRRRALGSDPVIRQNLIVSKSSQTLRSNGISSTQQLHPSSALVDLINPTKEDYNEPTDRFWGSKILQSSHRPQTPTFGILPVLD